MADTTQRTELSPTGDVGEVVAKVQADIAGHWTLDDERWDAHHHQHHSLDVAHARRHQDEALARDKAEAAVDKRLEGMNEFRAQLNLQAASFLTKDTFDTWKTEYNRRHEELRQMIVDLQKTDVKSEGKAIGQGVVIAAIVGGVAFIGTLIGLLVMIFNSLPE